MVIAWIGPQGIAKVMGQICNNLKLLRMMSMIDNIYNKPMSITYIFNKSIFYGAFIFLWVQLFPLANLATVWLGNFSTN